MIARRRLHCCSCCWPVMKVFDACRADSRCRRVAPGCILSESWRLLEDHCTCAVNKDTCAL